MSIDIIAFQKDRNNGRYDEVFCVEHARAALLFHQTLREYQETPLVSLHNLAHYLGIAHFYVKDESKRFGLNAFKGLGGSYALAKIIEQRLGIDLFDVHKVDQGRFLFVTATDGNHGRGIAWAAKKLGQKAIVYLPKGTAQERFDRILQLGAEAHITSLNYDDTVRFAQQQAIQQGGILVQDTAWQGYEEIPSWIMQGYLTMALELVQRLGDIRPTHIFLQAGVGAMAGALTSFFSHYYTDAMPTIVYVEPNQANCLYRTAKARDGKLHKVDGDLSSIMAGLCCGEVCPIGWDQIRQHDSFFVSCSDDVAADGMRILGHPLKEDERVVSGESGAVTTGVVCRLMRDNSLQSMRERLGLDENSVVVCFSTEGDTDGDNYRRIVWEGKYSRYE